MTDKADTTTWAFPMPQYLDMAREKAATTAQSEALAGIRDAAARIEKLERDLPAQLARNKQARGEQSEQLSRAARAEIASAGEQVQRQHLLQLRYCRRAGNAVEAARTLAEAQGHDLKGCVMLMNLMDCPEDRAAYAELVDAKRELRKRLREFCKTYA